MAKFKFRAKWSGEWVFGYCDDCSDDSSQFESMAQIYDTDSARDYKEMMLIHESGMYKAIEVGE